MSFPDNGAYYTFHLDPVASLQDIEDEEVAEAARRISPKVYVACTIKVCMHLHIVQHFSLTKSFADHWRPSTSPGV